VGLRAGEHEGEERVDGATVTLRSRACDNAVSIRLATNTRKHEIQIYSPDFVIS
jgi:hypothetical protein